MSDLWEKLSKKRKRSKTVSGSPHDADDKTTKPTPQTSPTHQIPRKPVPTRDSIGARLAAAGFVREVAPSPDYLVNSRLSRRLRAQTTIVSAGRFNQEFVLRPEFVEAVAAQVATQQSERQNSRWTRDFFNDQSRQMVDEPEDIPRQEGPSQTLRPQPSEFETRQAGLAHASVKLRRRGAVRQSSKSSGYQRTESMSSIFEQDNKRRLSEERKVTEDRNR